MISENKEQEEVMNEMRPIYITATDPGGPIVIEVNGDLGPYEVARVATGGRIQLFTVNLSASELQRIAELVASLHVEVLK